MLFWTLLLCDIISLEEGHSIPMVARWLVRSLEFSVYFNKVCLYGCWPSFPYKLCQLYSTKGTPCLLKRERFLEKINT